MPLTEQTLQQAINDGLSVDAILQAAGESDPSLLSKFELGRSQGLDNQAILQGLIGSLTLQQSAEEVPQLEETVLGPGVAPESIPIIPETRKPSISPGQIEIRDMDKYRQILSFHGFHPNEIESTISDFNASGEIPSVTIMPIRDVLFGAVGNFPKSFVKELQGVAELQKSVPEILGLLTELGAGSRVFRRVTRGTARGLGGTRAGATAALAFVAGEALERLPFFSRRETPRVDALIDFYVNTYDVLSPEGLEVFKRYVKYEPVAFLGDAATILGPIAGAIGKTARISQLTSKLNANKFLKGIKTGAQIAVDPSKVIDIGVRGVGRAIESLPLSAEGVDPNMLRIQKQFRESGDIPRGLPESVISDDPRVVLKEAERIKLAVSPRARKRLEGMDTGFIKATDRRLEQLGGVRNVGEAGRIISEGFNESLNKFHNDSRKLFDEALGKLNKGNVPASYAKTIATIDEIIATNDGPISALDPDLSRLKKIRDGLVEADTRGPKRPFEMTKADIVGENPIIDAGARAWNEEAFFSSDPFPQNISEPIHIGSTNNYAGIGRVQNQYAIADDANFNRKLLVHRLSKDGNPVDGNLGQWNPVGEYDGENVGIALAYRGEGAGTAFIEELIQRGEVKPSIGFSPEGLKTFENAHKNVIQKAIQEGKAIPANVLADYPDLKGKAKVQSKGITLNDVDKQRSAFRRILQKQPQEKLPPVLPENKAWADKVYSSLTDDLYDAAAAANPEGADLLRQSKANWREEVLRLNSNWGQAIKKFTDRGEFSQIIGELRKPSVFIQEAIPQMLNTLGPEGANTLRAAYLDDILTSSRSEKGRFTPTGLARQLRTRDNVVTQLLLGDDVARELEDVAAVMLASQELKSTIGGSQTAWNLWAMDESARRAFLVEKVGVATVGGAAGGLLGFVQGQGIPAAEALAAALAITFGRESYRAFLNSEFSKKLRLEGFEFPENISTKIEGLGKALAVTPRSVTRLPIRAATRTRIAEEQQEKGRFRVTPRQ